MKIINYSARIQTVDGKKSWTEDFTDLVVDDMLPLRHCQFLISRFNDTLRPGEKARKVLNTRTSKNTSIKPHDWEKKNLVIERGSSYYVYQCKNCGATGKRHGAIPFITPDRKHTLHCKFKRKRTS